MNDLGPVTAGRPVTIEIDDGAFRWRFDADFLRSRWRCRWGDGCLGMLERPAPELRQGCCSHGAYLSDEAVDDTAHADDHTAHDHTEHDHDGGDGDTRSADDGEDREPAADALELAAHAALLAAEQWQFHDVAHRRGERGDLDRGGPLAIFVDDGTATRVVDGACIFLNRPGFPGGEGCALHLAALAAGDPPAQWKPSVCWQLPLLVDWHEPAGPGEPSVIDVRRWRRDDYGEHGEEMAWCCTEPDDRRLVDAFDGTAPVVDSMRDELVTIAGTEVYVELRRRLRSR